MNIQPICPASLETTGTALLCTFKPSSQGCQLVGIFLKIGYDSPIQDDLLLGVMGVNQQNICATYVNKALIFLTIMHARRWSE